MSGGTVGLEGGGGRRGRIIWASRVEETRAKLVEDEEAHELCDCLMRFVLRVVCMCCV